MFTWLRWFAMILPVAWLARRIDPASVLRAIHAVGFSAFLVALGSQSASIAAGAWRWRWLLHAYGAERSEMPPQTELIRHSLVGLYFSLLPSGLVGEVVRARRTEDVLPVPADAYVVAVLDRITGALGLLVLASISVFVSPIYAANEGILTALRAVAAVSVVASLAIVGLPFVLARSPALREWAARIPLAGGALSKLTPPRRPTSMLVALLLSVVTQGLTVVTLAALVAPLAPTRSPAELLGPLPTIILLTFVPITPGGVGQRELVFVGFLEPLGISASDATAASLVTMMVTFSLAAVGGVLYAWDVTRGRGNRTRTPASGPPPET